jgi:hypothetical protein
MRRGLQPFNQAMSRRRCAVVVLALLAPIREQ